MTTFKQKIKKNKLKQKLVYILKNDEYIIYRVSPETFLKIKILYVPDS